MPIPNAITAASIKLKFPAFRDSSDAQIEFAIEEASLMVDPLIYGDWYLVALQYLIGHFLTVQQQRMVSGTGQLIQSVSVGGEISYTFGSPASAAIAGGLVASEFGTTPYGQRYLEIGRLVIPSVAII